jgi:hypothetical protein
MLGRAAVAMWWNVAPEMRDEFEHWHTHEHIPERLSIPGFLRGTRWSALDGSPSFFVLYEAARLAVLTGKDYLARLNDPTPWSRKMMPHHLDMVRSLCRVRASAGSPLARALTTVRFSPRRRGARAVADWLAQDMLPQVTQRKGMGGGCLLQAQLPDVATRTTEQQIRGNDGTADWVLVLSGYDATAVEMVGNELRSALADRRADVNPHSTIYAPAYSLSARELSVD